MAESIEEGTMDLTANSQENLDKNADFPPPTLQKESKDFCDSCKVFEAAKFENLTVTISKLEEETEKLRIAIKDLLVETGRDPESLDHLLTSYQAKENLNKDAAKNCAVQKALSNSLILRKIFRYLDDVTLLKLRPVCKFWAEEASACILMLQGSNLDKGIREGPRVQVRLCYNNRERTLGKEWVGLQSTLVGLITSGLAVGRKFPCSSFSLACPNIFSVPDAVKFLEKFGCLMESLDFKLFGEGYADAKIIAECLRSLLLKWAPKLKYFSFTAVSLPLNSSSGLFEEGDLSSEYTLPNLQVLNWSYHAYHTDMPSALVPEMFLDVLRISPNLTKILGDPELEKVVEANKAGAIKKIEVNFESSYRNQSYREHQMSRLALVSDHCFQVEEIQVKYDFICMTGFNDGRSKVHLLNKVLQNNKNCLNKIICQNFGPLTELGLKIPEMPNLKTLDVTTEFNLNSIPAQNLVDQKIFRIFPGDLDVGRAFPKLAPISWKIKITDVYSYYGTNNASLQLPLIDTVGPLTSVRSLTFEIVDSKHLKFLHQISECLSNVRVLKVDYSEGFKAMFFPDDAENRPPGVPELFRIIWKNFPGLEEVHLFLYPHDDTFKEILPKQGPAHQVDSAITGLDLATVRKLAGNLSDNNEFGKRSKNFTEGQEKDPAPPSILNMKNLRHLKIFVRGENIRPILTHISGTHGFGLMNNLAVVIMAYGEKSLVIDDPKGAMSPNVEFFQLG